tara:strand:- start:104 stop:1381 length:1278 start_codon:yes stop_codon:yes gene_type:complete
MPSSKKNIIYIFLIVLSMTSYIYGFVVKEDSAGGGLFDFNNTWNNQTTFDNNSLTKSIRNTKTAEIRDNINSHFPFSYILNKFLNPFSKDKEKFLKSIFILNFFVPLIFFFGLKNNYANKNLYLIGCLSSILYLSPYFRTSSYWAGMENYGLFMFVISFYFFSNYQNKKNYIKFNIIFFSIFSCFCVYFDQKLLIIPLVYMFLFFKNETNKDNIILYLITNIILSIPVLLLIYYWGSVISPHDTESRKFGDRLFLEQIGYCISIILFYLTPYMFIYHKKILEYLLNNKKIIIILTIVFSAYILLILLFPTNYGRWDSFGKGWLHKLSQVLFDNNLYQKIFTYFVFYVSMIAIFAAAQKRLILIYFTLFFIFISSVILPIFQEYFDPLMLIFLTLFFYKEDEINDKFVKFYYFFSAVFLISLNLYY